MRVRLAIGACALGALLSGMFGSGTRADDGGGTIGSGTVADGGYLGSGNRSDDGGGTIGSGTVADGGYFGSGLRDGATLVASGEERGGWIVTSGG